MKEPIVKKKKAASKKAVKPHIRFAKCIHTFKCLFNKDCEKVARSELNKMTKDKLELLGRSHGIELDKRKSKKKLVSELYEALSK